MRRKKESKSKKKKLQEKKRRWNKWGGRHHVCLNGKRSENEMCERK